MTDAIDYLEFRQQVIDALRNRVSERIGRDVPDFVDSVEKYVDDLRRRGKTSEEVATSLLNMRGVQEQKP